MIGGRDSQVDTSLVTTAAGALAVLCAATSFAGVLGDARWLIPGALTVAAVAGTGAIGRHFRWHPALTPLAQLLALLLALTWLFTTGAALGLIPTPTSSGQLVKLLGEAGGVVRTGVPPVPADPPLQAMLCLGLGVVALLVDVIAVGVGSPAVTGLVLLCVFAIPASLAERMLPWWTFALGAAGYALLLASTGGHRRWRRRETADRVAHTMFGHTTAAVAGTAGVIAILAGSAFTGVGTEGRLPGSVPEQFGGTDGIGLQPFTSLRGQLNRDRVVELFRVRGLEQDTYLRALTLREFDPNRGWRIDGLTQGVDADRPLPLPQGTTIARGERETIHIQPIGYRDPWLPVFGTPLQVSGMGRQWRYDPASGIVFTQHNQESRAYTQRVVLPDPSPEELRNARGPMPIDRAYLDIAGVPPEVADLARQLTAGESNPFDKAVAINRHFTDPSNGFQYTLQTAPNTGRDALVDFLFHGKRGFCEQYASAMAVLLRSAGIPSRVAVGFTGGYQDGGERVITTDDAHAWVEAFFPGWGWQRFDPTPLSDGRTALPQFLGNALHPPQQPAPSAPGEPQPTRPGTPPAPAPEPGGPEQAAPAQPEQRREVSTRTDWTAPVLVLVLVLGCAALATPLAVREMRRRRRMELVAAGGRGAAGAAWAEILDEFRDRGARPGDTETARQLAEHLIGEHALDTEGAEGLRSLVAEVEREWYAPVGAATGNAAEPLRRTRTALEQAAPLDLRARLFPASALPPWRR
ncbi:transglutaminaseTgpA domain-containing protein [Saccharopolyspora griseoalba]|uniref:TransglutaminaseTgpA domain-containing protein n=1 Tax=Saccharopolyspora griseoalba TaxID=1431848 RepID=A0ABW2LGQ3_9PSEU